MPISLEKIQQNAPELIVAATIAQAAIGASPLNGQLSKVALCLDYSGSMSREYARGAMQRLAEKVLALGTQLDDDGAIDLFVFDSSAAYLGEVSIANFRGAVADLTRSRRMGSTDYAGAFDLVTKHYGGKKSLFGKQKAADLPTLVLFLTDGVPDDPRKAITALTSASTSPIFWQFLSIGGSPIPFLEKLDDLDGRYIDNADYKPVGDVDRLTDAMLFHLLLDEYPEWVAEMRRRGRIQ